MRRARAVAAAAVAAALLLAACSSDSEPAPTPAPPVSSSPGTPVPPAGSASPADVDVPEPDLDLALSEPQEDSVYPDVGDPGVDALHYDLDLAWTPEDRELRAVETLTFRATETADDFQLDLSKALEVTSLSVDGEEAPYAHDGKNLVVQVPVEADERHVVEIEYGGTPRPVAAPTRRSDFSTVGWTITDEGETWTMQEPYGAYSWYAVNDHPSDKALYDFTISVPSPWVGVANGELFSRTEDDSLTTTSWHLAEPAASYLTTVAIGDFEMTRDESESGVPITLWTPRDQPQHLRRLRSTADALDWAEEQLGPYPYDTLGIVLVDSSSGMETQTMITLGTTEYATSEAVLVHEIVHHWYGNEVTPADWRDVWMNEGMAMYLQGRWQAEEEGTTVDTVMDYWASFEPDLREDSGPPADYDPASFGASNIYYGPALMWHELYERIGDDAFTELLRAWPAVHRNGNAERDDYLPWLEEQTGLELTPLFDAWLLGETSPSRT